MREQKPASNDVALFGGSTYDVTGVLLKEARPNDSNPSRIRACCGGVGRNIAENLARLGLGVRFVSAFGTDAFSREMIASCEAVGIDTGDSYIAEGARGGAYVNLLDAKGELLIAASDLSLIEEFPDDLLRNSVSRANACKLAVVDANLTEDALSRIAGQCEIPLIGDAVSVAKAGRFRRVFPHMHALKTNIGELAALADREIKSDRDLIAAMACLRAAGVERVFVTMGRDGACCFDGDGMTRVPGFPAEVRSVTGAGDAFCAAVVYGIYHGLPATDILMLGTAMSHITLASPLAVSRDMTKAEALRVKDALTAPV
jgi:pseudouridine kinase